MRSHMNLKLVAVFCLLFPPLSGMTNPSQHTAKILSTNEQYDTDVPMKKVVRTFENEYVYLDAIPESDTYDDIIEDSLIEGGMMSNFNYDETNTYNSFEEAESVKDEVSAAIQRYGYGDGTFFVPSTFNPNDTNCLATTPEKFICALNNSTHSLNENLLSLKNDTSDSDTTDEEDDNMILVNSDLELLNVFVAGINGSASHWSNNGSVEDNSICKGTLPYELAKKFHSDIYIASNQSDIYSFTLRKLSYETISENNFANTLFSFESVTSTEFAYEDLLNGSIILYEDDLNKCSYHNNFYEPYEWFLEHIMSYCPNVKFNLFGHSRGGLINLDFASNHAEVVNDIFSLGTPYYTPMTSDFVESVDNLSEDPNNCWCAPLSSALKGLVNDIAPMLDAYHDLNDEEKERGLRQNWNECDRTTMKLHTFGYGFTFDFSIFISILFWVIRLDFSIDIPWDGCVGTQNALGLPTTYMPINSFGILMSICYYLTLLIYTDQTEPVNATSRTQISIHSFEIIDALTIGNYGLSMPDQPPVPHNMETMHPKTIRKICDIINNEYC